MLVLAPLTPTGSHSFIELVSATPPEEMNLLAVTYTQPPHLWVEDWRSKAGELPAGLSFIHAGQMQSSVEELEENLSRSVEAQAVDPRDPMEIIAPVGQRFDEWASTDRRTVLSVQTLTVLLEYVDFDTVFRYLHILTHKVTATGATGYYQADPDLHDQETLNTLKVLFDVVVEIEDGEWAISSPGANPERTRETPPTPSPAGAESVGHESDAGSTTTDSASAETEKGTSALEQVVSRVRGLFTGDATADSTDADADQSAADESNAATDGIDDEMLLTDDERIRQLLLQSGGRMKQTDIVAETDWSRSSVSRKLSAMEEKGMITRFQIGRGNLVFLSGYEPDAADSPYEEATN
ncbi:helix-turn-helix transcriptional regulator [Natrononativus amylolyticus]|uniref:helix-turn-helix transcriptional regulator n=1 Tax=Natrononativus amylolyticus TaxID=2963434 RepID=UPI0020CF2AF5|nr:helix-turn-helix domain-containing protein [Natrononativus amylolyticus]